MADLFTTKGRAARGSASRSSTASSRTAGAPRGAARGRAQGHDRAALARRGTRGGRRVLIWFVLALLVLLSGMYRARRRRSSLDEAAVRAASSGVSSPNPALLVTILLANLVVNLAFFALAPAPRRSLSRGVEASALAGGFLALVTPRAGEIVPKALRFARRSRSRASPRSPSRRRSGSSGRCGASSPGCWPSRALSSGGRSRGRG